MGIFCLSGFISISHLKLLSLLLFMMLYVYYHLLDIVSQLLFLNFFLYIILFYCTHYLIFFCKHSFIL